MLYAGKMLLLLGDTDASLRKVMSLISWLGDYLDLTINWAKLAVLPLDGIVSPDLPSFLPDAGYLIL